MSLDVCMHNFYSLLSRPHPTVKQTMDKNEEFILILILIIIIITIIT